MASPLRHPTLQTFLDRVEACIIGDPATSAAALQASKRIFDALRDRIGAPAGLEPDRLPVCQHIEGALSAAELGPQPVRALAAAFAAIAQDLTWRRRSGAESQTRAFADGHANAMIVGPGGIEPRDDVWIGVSLMAPDTTYPDHQHPPEEVYVVLSEGDWRRVDEAWFTPGIGGIVYNPPGIVHAMRSGAQPLLAIWCLWIQ